MSETHSGGCYCGAVELEMSGPPLDMGYCHCTNCRKYSGAPVNAFTLWKTDDVKVRKGSELLTHFQSSEISDRRYCSKCGSHVMIDHPKLGLVDARARFRQRSPSNRPSTSTTKRPSFGSNTGCPSSRTSPPPSGDRAKRWRSKTLGGSVAACAVRRRTVAGG